MKPCGSIEERRGFRSGFQDGGRMLVHGSAQHVTTLVNNPILNYHKIQRTPNEKKKKKQLRKWRIRGDFKFQDTYTAAIDDVFFVVVVVQRVPRFQF